MLKHTQAHADGWSLITGGGGGAAESLETGELLAMLTSGCVIELGRFLTLTLQAQGKNQTASQSVHVVYQCGVCQLQH